MKRLPIKFQCFNAKGEMFHQHTQEAWDITLSETIDKELKFIKEGFKQTTRIVIDIKFAPN